MGKLTLVSDIMAGTEGAPFCAPAKPRLCPLCFALAVLPLDEKNLAKQPDATTHVCHPSIDGCNFGFEHMPEEKNDG